MKYEKANGEVINFGTYSFLVDSNSPAAEQRAIEAASSAATSSYGGNARVASIDRTEFVDDGTGNGYWIVELTVTNNGGNKPKRYKYENGVLTEI